MTEFEVNNCNGSQSLRIQLARASLSDPWSFIGGSIPPGGLVDFDRSIHAGAMRLSSINGSTITGIYIFTNRIEEPEIYFKTNNTVSSVSCSGRPTNNENLTRLVLNNCLSNQVTLFIRVANGTMRSTRLVLPPTGQGSRTVYIPLGSVISVSGTGAPCTTYTVNGTDLNIFINTGNIGPGGFVMPVPPIFDVNAFIIGNCSAFNRPIQILGPAPLGSTTNTNWNNLSNLVVPGNTSSQSNFTTIPNTIGSPAVVRLGQGLLTSNGTTFNQGETNAPTIGFIFDSRIVPASTQIWYLNQNQIFNQDSAGSPGSPCGVQNPRNGNVSTIVLRNCGNTISSVSIGPSRQSLLPTTVTIGPNQSTIIGVMGMSTVTTVNNVVLGFTLSSGSVGTFSLPTNGNMITLYIGSNSVGTSESAVCTSQPPPTTGLFTAYNCQTSPYETCSGGNRGNFNWVLDQEFLDINSQNLSGGKYQDCIASRNPGTGIAVPSRSSINTSSVAIALVRLQGSSSTSNFFVYTADAPVNQVSFSANSSGNGIVSSLGCTSSNSSSEQIVNLSIENCNKDNSVNLEVSSGGNFISTGKAIQAGKTVMYSFVQGTNIRFSGTNTSSDTYTVTSSDSQIYVGSSTVANTSCGDANSSDTRNPIIIILIIAIGVILLIGIVLFLYYGSRQSATTDSEVAATQPPVTLHEDPSTVQDYQEPTVIQE